MLAQDTKIDIQEISDEIWDPSLFSLLSRDRQERKYKRGEGGGRVEMLNLWVGRDFMRLSCVFL